MATISKCVSVGTLIALFLFYITSSYLKKITEPTSFEEIETAHSATFPSITVCPRKWGQDNFQTFEDVKVSIDEFKAKTSAWLGQEGIGVTHSLKDLKNASVLSTYFNATLDYVWEVSAIMQPQKSNPLIPCLTLNIPPYLDLESKQGIHFIKVKVTENGDNLYFSKHDYHQSQANFHIDQSVSFEILKPGLGYIEYLVQTETTLLNKARYACLEGNSMYLKVCLDNFINGQLGCSLPWTPITDEIRVCETEDDLKAFRNLSFHMTSKDIQKLITQQGCFKPNCKKTTWTKNQYIETWPVSSDKTEFYIMITSNSKVLQRKEVLLADLQTFVADIGSYLGFFLGASILSLTELGITYLKKTCKAILDKFFSKSI